MADETAKIQEPATQAVSRNVFTAPSHGWRGLEIPGNHKRKWYTVLHNEYVLVTAFVALPGERSIRHTHETGELNISFVDPNRPIVRWNPPGMPHGGSADPVTAELDERIRGALARVGEKTPDVQELLEEILQRQVDISDRLAEFMRPQPGLRVALDCLFPPFKTTIDDPLYPEKKTVVGQWYD
jgi:hypothetical protein